MGKNIEKLAEFVAQTRWEDVPEPVRQHTKLVFLDTLGVILAGAETARGAAVARTSRGHCRRRSHGLRARLADA